MDTTETDLPQEELLAKLRTRVMVIFGGRSGEHEISCATASNVLAAIDRERFDVIAVGVTKDGRWLRVPDDPQLYRLEGGTGAVIESGPNQLALVTGEAAALEISATAGAELTAYDLGAIDVALPLIHGSYGEDGALQGLLEMADIKYVGSGIRASAICLDKHTCKTILAGRGLPVGRWVFISPQMWKNDRNLALAQAASLGFPVFVKPCRGGSSIGISKVEDADGLGKAIEMAASYDPRVIVEAANPGREIEAAVLGGRHGGETRVAPLGEIILESGSYYDYRTKYLDTKDAILECPAQLSEEATLRIQEAAVDVFDTLGCEGFARVDFFYDLETSAITVNEVNTLPGLTQFSLFPIMWDAGGIDYRAMISELIDLALERPAELR